MNDCVYEATARHASWLGIGLDGRDFAYYRVWKKFYMSDVDVPIWGGVAPMGVAIVVAYHGLRHKLEYDVWTPAHYVTSAETDVLRLGSEACWTGATEGITLAPAIYLVLDARHAVFALEKPSGLVVAAIQLIKKGF